MEELSVQGLVAIFGPHGEEDVPADEFVDNLALSREGLEDDFLVISQLDHHMLGFPVDVPSLKKGIIDMTHI